MHLVRSHAVELLNLPHADTMRGGDAEQRVSRTCDISRVCGEIGAAIVAGTGAFAAAFDAAHIALKHKTTAAALASANKIKDVNKIVVGQRIKIPGRTTTVVSSKHSAPSTHESSDTVPLPGFGMADVVPPPPAAGLTPAPAPAPSVPAKPAVTNDSHRGILAYRVDRTDTIETIAQQFSTTPQHIREMNRLDAATPLKPGDEIMVPAMGAVSVSSR